jgi:hypothetical protein
LFIIWKNGTTVASYRELAEQHAERFGGPKKKEVTIRGWIHDIKQLEKATGRKYLQHSQGARGEYRIDRKHFVDLQWTAMILLELDKGYKHIEHQIFRDKFERYLADKYEWDKSLISGRIEYLQRNAYIAFYQLMAGGQCIAVEDRLEHEVEYFKLIVDDYYQEQRRENPKSPLTGYLKKLIAQYRSDEIPTKAEGGNI